MLSDGSTLYVPGVGQWNGTSWVYALADGLGSVRQLSDANGAIVQSYTYAPFGELLAAQGTRSSALQYTGEQKDVDTGLVYLRARWYDSATGRFTTRDPFPGFAVLLQTLHPYVYVNNNPVNLTDPSGKFVFVLLAAVLGGIIGGVSYYTIQAFINADPCLGVQWYWQEALFWGGAGGVIGGLLGTAAYGGWQLGAKAIAWIKALSGGATTCATNQSCRKITEAFRVTAESVLDKAYRYFLNPEHPVGGSKSEWFRQALGYTRDNMVDLTKQIIFDPSQAVPTILTQYGQKYEQVISITGANGKVIDVTFVWIRNLDGFVRLVTAIPPKP